MHSQKKLAGRTLPFLVLVSMLAACNPASAAQTTPTMDPNMIYTAAAVTVQAQLTQNAALTPSATATMEPTQTLSVPTADTSLPTLGIPGSVTQAATQPGLSTQAVATLTPLPGAGLATQSGVKPARVFQWISNDPPDGTVMESGTKFDIGWTVKNTGTTTWTKAYTYAWFSGDKFFEHLKYNLPKEVKPGEEITVLVDANAPTKSGKYYTWWKLINDQGQNIGDMDLTITVAQPGETPKAPTSTPKP